MKPKGLLIAVGLLAVLGGAVWWSNKKQASASKSADTSTKVLAIPTDQVQEVRVKSAAQTVDLKRENGKWQLTQPEPLPADQDAASTVASAFTALNADTVVDEKPTDLGAYGLKTPNLDVQIVKKDGKTDNLLVGDETPTGSGNYAKVASDPRVFTISSNVKNNIDKTPNDLRDKRLLTFDSDKLTRVELAANNTAIEFGKNNQNEWQIIKPRPLRADGAQVDTLISNLKDGKLDPAEDPKKAASAFASAMRVAVATVTDAGGSQTLEVRKDKDNAYAKSSVVMGPYKVAGDLAKNLDKKLDDFRNKKIFDFGFSDPSYLEVKGVAYTKDGDKWKSGAKTLDNTSVQNVIDKLRDLSATGFPEKGGGDPVMDANVTSNQGKRIEKVSITKQGNQFFAKRQDEPSIYALDSKALEDLQKAVSEIKEAAPPAPAKKK
jgi:hypothetical protein